MTNYDIAPWVAPAEYRKHVRVLMKRHKLKMPEARRLYALRVSTQPKANNGNGGGHLISFERMLGIL
jgi:hypothetical protein